MTYDAMTCFVEMRGEASLARIMHDAHWPKKPKRDQVGRPDNRTGKQAEHIAERIKRVKKFKGIFSKRDVADRLAISTGAADYLVRRMVEGNIIRQALRLGGEGEFKYKVEKHEGRSCDKDS